jgi:hypothetical protein
MHPPAAPGGSLVRANKDNAERLRRWRGQRMPVAKWPELFGGHRAVRVRIQRSSNQRLAGALFNRCPLHLTSLQGCIILRFHRVTSMKKRRRCRSLWLEGWPRQQPARLSLSTRSWCCPFDSLVLLLAIPICPAYPP